MSKDVPVNAQTTVEEGESASESSVGMLSMNSSSIFNKLSSHGVGLFHRPARLKSPQERLEELLQRALNPNLSEGAMLLTLGAIKHLLNEKPYLAEHKITARGKLHGLTLSRALNETHLKDSYKNELKIIIAHITAPAYTQKASPRPSR